MVRLLGEGFSLQTSRRFDLLLKKDTYPRKSKAWLVLTLPWKVSEEGAALFVWGR